MAIIKRSELKQMTEQQIAGKLADLNNELMKIRSQLSTKTTLENPGRVRAVKKTIARLHTMLHQKKSKPAQLSTKKQQEVRKKA